MSGTERLGLLDGMAGGDFCHKVVITLFICGFLAFYSALEESEGGAGVGEGGGGFVGRFL